MEELVSDLTGKNISFSLHCRVTFNCCTGLQEFTSYLQTRYSHENIRFWMAVNDLRRSSQSQIQSKVKEIYA
jgi:hypothetical protein